jgi:hypothetical protein
MLDDFAQLLAEVFPSVTPETAQRFIASAKQRSPIAGELYSPVTLPGICQSDILGPLTFRIVDDQGRWTQAEGYGLVLSHSCDIENDEYVIISYGFPMAEFRDEMTQAGKASYADAVERNTIDHLFFLPAVPGAGDLVFDLSIVSSYSSRFVAQALNVGTIRPYASLSQFGFYLFIAKLTVHLLRPETEVDRPAVGRSDLRDRFKAALRILRG